MTQEQFNEYALYISTREYARLSGVNVGEYDAWWSKGNRPSSDMMASKPFDQLAALGDAMSIGAVVPGWNNQTGEMDWRHFACFVNWFGRLTDQQRALAITRTQQGSETPWLPEKPVYAGERPALASPAETDVLKPCESGQLPEALCCPKDVLQDAKLATATKPGEIEKKGRMLPWVLLGTVALAIAGMVYFWYTDSKRKLTETEPKLSEAKEGAP